VYKRGALHSESGFLVARADIARNRSGQVDPVPAIRGWTASSLKLSQERLAGTKGRDLGLY
jgi:hypothetical protein